MLIRERPPLRVTVEIETPDGKHYRWAADEPAAENVPGSLRRTSAMPGGYAEMECTLPRSPSHHSVDLARLSTLRVRSVIEQVGEYRLERTPRVSGERVAISPAAVGWQAHLDDDKAAREVFVDRELAAWGSPPLNRQIFHLNAGRTVDADYTVDTRRGLAFSGPSGRQIPSAAIAEVVYIAPAGVKVGAIMYQATQQNTGSMASPELRTSDVDDLDPSSTTALTIDDTLRTATPTAGRYAALRALSTATHTPAAGSPFARTFKKLAVYGNHGITLTAISGEPSGLLASSMIAHALAEWCPLLGFTTGADGTIQTSTFVIPHAAFKDPSGVGAWVRDLARYEVLDWAVWDDKTFYLHERNARGRTWRARVGPAQLEETGPQADRLWNSVIVAYRDVDGTTRTVGPTGSGADTEDADLEDTDSANPANQLGINRREVLQMGTATAASATAVGARFLEQAKLLDRSGRARIIGHIEDDHGILHPYSHVRAGDRIEFVDADDTSLRRIVRADHNDNEHACTIDLDAPPEGLQALLEQLDVSLVGVGV